jgi:radical SAM protein with 4Fe4S-binding SPASM domain
MTQSISKFLVVDTGVEFLYDNRTNSIYDTSGQPVLVDKRGHKALDNSGSLKKSKRPKHLRIAMGKLCNMSCSYCLQDDLGGLKDILDPNVDKFLEDLQKLNLEGLERVELWGGETFAYWPTMKRIFEVLDKDGLVWYLPTNGTLLRDIHVDYLGKLKGNIAIGISHDGPKTADKNVRGRDPFPRLGPVLKKIDSETKISYSLNATMSQDNCDMYKVYMYFCKISGDYGLSRMGFEFDKVESYDFMSWNKTIHGDNLEIYRKSLRHFFTMGIPESRFSVNLNRDRRKFAESIKGTSQTSLQSRCGADWTELISVDINGDVLTCPMVGSDSHKCGTLDKIEDAESVKLNFMREHNGNGDGCINCPVLLLCNKGCPLDLADTFRSRSCDLLKVHNSEIQLAAFRLLFQSEIEYRGRLYA